MNAIIKKVFGVNLVENKMDEVSVEGCAVCDAVTSWFKSTPFCGIWAKWDSESVELFFRDTLLFQKVKSAV